jgi:hypothetical protein
MAKSKLPGNSRQSESEAEREQRLEYHRRYYRENRDRLLAQCAEYRRKNADAKREADKAYYQANREKLKARSKLPAGRAIQRRYRQNNKDALRQRHSDWRENNRDHLRQYKKRRMQQNPELVLISRIRCRTRCALKTARARKSAKTLHLVGCSAKELAVWIESQFTDGMCWARIGEIHIDHVIPLAKFNLAEEEQQRAAFHYTNLRPMWDIDNKRKSDRVPGQVLFGFAYAAKIKSGLMPKRSRCRRSDEGLHGDH